MLQNISKYLKLNKNLMANVNVTYMVMMDTGSD